ncbi:MAG: PHB depolymerase family esterase [Sphingobacteriaceae bacterium]|nr:PHB depolymerase family esterase [Sphingobacteriaceae bacterium]
MLKIIYLIISFLLICQSFYCQSDYPLKEIEEFGENPGNLRMYIYKSGKDSAKIPLVVMLHGCGENANAVAELSGWNKLAYLNNFLMLYPQQKGANNPNSCFNWFLKKDIEKGSGENESIFEMISYLQKKYNVDTTQIFISGLSAGAAMSIVMSATHPQLFKSAAVFAGGAYKSATNAFQAVKVMRGNVNYSDTALVRFVKEQNPNYTGAYPKLIIYHGINDGVVDYRNSKYLVSQWAGLHQIDTIADKETKAYAGIKDITKWEYNNALGENKINLYLINNLGHRLMVKRQKRR